MKRPTYSPFYTGAKRRIWGRDVVCIDLDGIYTVGKVIPPGARDARDFSMYETGGLLLRSIDICLTILRFGDAGIITKGRIRGGIPPITDCT